MRKHVHDLVTRLVALGVAPNGDAEGRALAEERFGDQRVGTCGHLSRGILESLRHQGVAPRCLVHVAAARPLRLNGLPDLSDFYNFDHAATCVVTSSGPRFIDAWLHGQETGSLAGHAARNDDLLTPEVWFSRMFRRGYASFTLESDGSKTIVSTATAFRQWLLARHQPVPRTDSPRPSEARTVDGAPRCGEPSGATS